MNYLSYKWQLHKLNRRRGREDKILSKSMEGTAELEGHLIGHPDKKIHMRLTRIALLS